MRILIGLLFVVLLCGCSKEDTDKTSTPNTIINNEFTELNQPQIVLGILDRDEFREAMPPDTEVSLEEYYKLKARYAEKHGNWDFRYALTFREKEGEDWRKYWLRLESFDENSVWIAELTQYRSKGWDWIARYRIKRTLEVDKEFKIRQILEKRSKVIGGIKYGMSVDKVLALKGEHYKIHRHAEAGSAYLIYDDVKVSVRG